MAAFHLLAFLPFILLIPTNAHKITAILDAFPDYSIYNNYLSQTKVSDEINSHQSVTCLVLPNSAMSVLVAKQSLPGIKNVLRLLSILKYFDPLKPHYHLPSGTTVATTLYQISGSVGNQGYIRISFRRGGPVIFASARFASAFHATYTKSVQQIPYSLSVLEVSTPITFPGLMDAPPAPSNLTAFLENAGCKIFASLIASTGVLQMYQSIMSKGLTLFAPNDDAFKVDGAPDITALSRTDLVTVLQYHALPSYIPKASLQTAWGPIATMASSGSGNYNLSVTSHGDDVSLNTGVGTARIASTLLDYTPLCVIIVDSLLLPTELLVGAPVPAASGLVDRTPMSAPSVAMVPTADTPDNSDWMKRPRRPHRRPPPSPRKHSPSPPHHHSPPSPPSPDDPVYAPPPNKNGSGNNSVAYPVSVVSATAFFLFFLL